jgi:hypothetical protein
MKWQASIYVKVKDITEGKKNFSLAKSWFQTFFGHCKMGISSEPEIL